MFPQNRTWLIILLIMAGSVYSAPDDEVSRFLERFELKQLLAVRLEERLQTAAPDKRSELILQLAGLYAELLESISDPQQKIAIREQSRALLAHAPSNSADELRLALLRGSYRSAERQAEDHRLRLNSPDDVAAAVATLEEIIPQLQSLRTDMKDRADVAQRRHARSAGNESVMLANAAEMARNLHWQCTFLTAWALYYQSWLNDRAENARVAEPLFAELLSTDTPSPNPDDVSEDLRSHEAVARAILGMGLCKSLTSSPPTAIGWIDLLEHPNSYQPLREQAPVWKIAIFLENGKYGEAQRVLETRRQTQELPIGWLRLVAVSALEDPSRSGPRNDLIRFAITELAARGELEQIYDLATRWGTDALGDRGFALRYVRGVMEYQTARNSHGNDRPTMDSALVSQYQKSEEELNAALRESDASKYPPAAAACHRLIAWCRYYRSEFLAAKSAFQVAADQLSGAQSAEALWMAIISLNTVVEARENAALEAELEALIDRFLSEHPSSEYAPKLRLKRIVDHNRPTLEAANELLSIPPDSEVYEPSRHYAADILYRLFRQATGSDRVTLANRFLTIALELIGPEARARIANESEANRCFIRCRQVLEVSLDDEVGRTGAARTAFAAIDDLYESHPIDSDSFEDEIEYRQLQERLASDNFDAAQRIADDLWARSADGIWSRKAARDVFRHAYRLSKDSPIATQDQQDVLQVIVRHGGRVIHEFRNQENGLEARGAISYYAAVADASMILWQQSGDEERGRAALFLYDQLLTVRPRQAEFLRAAAVLSHKLGEPNDALDHWRRLAAGADPGSNLFFEARFNIIKLLAQSDPSHAREVMNQHIQLYPTYGPDPWGPMLKGIDVQLPESSAQSSAPGEEVATDIENDLSEDAGEGVQP